MIAVAETPTLAETMRRKFTEAAMRARREARPVLVSQTIAIPVPDSPVAFFARGNRRHAYRVFWERPAAGMALVGLGAARVIPTNGPERFRQAAEQIRDDVATLGDASPCDAIDGAPGGPVYLGGFGFDPLRPPAPEWRDFPPGLLVLPRLLLTVREGAASLTLNGVVEPDADPVAAAAAAMRDLVASPVPDSKNGHEPGRRPRLLASAEVPTPEAWKAAVAETAADVRAGRFAKVVLARKLRLQADAVFDPVSALGRLRDANPSAYVFAVATPDRCFLGATPELLVRLAGRDVEVSCLAGSIGRGETPAEDERLAQALLASAKDRTEHEVVVNAAAMDLAKLCDPVVRAPATPRVIRFRGVQHLATPLQGRLANGACVLDLVERLHPTPAVGGFPRDVALAAIREREGIDRGWYAGPVGWVDQTGSGEFGVAIRSGLLTGHEAVLYAGCGIVGASDADAEYAETCLKLKPMLAALDVS